MALQFASSKEQKSLTLWQEEYEAHDLTGVQYEETVCKSALNRISGGPVPFSWSINPYRGCSHACKYCFARPTHEYLDLNMGEDFDKHIVVKTNIAAVLRRELRRGHNGGELVAQGTNTDPYQRAERLYRLTRAILEALRDWKNPTSITTKSPAVVNDIDLLSQLAAGPGATVNLSVGSLDREAWKLLEPGTARPDKRLEAVRQLNEAGVPAGILMAPIVPFFSDGQEQLEQTVAQAAAAGARWLMPIPLHLRPKIKQYFMAWLAESRPDLVPKYRDIYGDRANASREYRRQLGVRVAKLKAKYGIRRKQ